MPDLSINFRCLKVSALILLGVAGCHIRAGFGPAPASSNVEHSIIRDTTETKDGGKNVDETDSTTTSFDDGRSTTVRTVTRTVTQPDGTSSHSRTETKEERSRNGSVTT